MESAKTSPFLPPPPVFAALKAAFAWSYADASVGETLIPPKTTPPVTVKISVDLL